MLGQPLKKWDCVGIIFGIIGMLMLVQPFKGASEDDPNYSWQNDLIGCVFGLLAAFNSSLTLVYLSRLSKSISHFSIVTLYYMLGSSIMSPIWS
jgi:drug/metabolite transporter (DMT)-like permease